MNKLDPRSRWRHLLWGLPLAVLLFYGLSSYVVAPEFWRVYTRHHPALDLAQRRTRTATGIPGDPINLAFVGSQQDLMRVAALAGWVPADPITWASSLRIVINSATHRAYTTAPVSDLFLWGRKQDVAFEQPYGPDPSKRHHVRFWRSNVLDEDGQPLWLGAATFDKSVGVSHLTGQVTHHIDANLDWERDKLAGDFAKVSGLMQDWLDDFQPDKRGKNGGGDPFFTDGRLCMMRLVDPNSILGTAQQWLAPVLDLLKGSASNQGSTATDPAKR